MNAYVWTQTYSIAVGERDFLLLMYFMEIIINE